MNIKAKDIKSAFGGRSSVTTEELASYFQDNDKQLSPEGIRKRISRLKRMGVLVSISQGVYALTEKPEYNPVPNAFIIRLARSFSTAFPEIDSCIWSSAWLYDFMVHQPANYFYLIETEGDMVQTAFNLLKDQRINAWLNPDEQMMQLYIMGSRDPVIVKSLISRAPIMKRKAAKLPMLEKILVDAWAEKNLFFFMQGQELTNIFNFAFDQYSITYSRLLGYARRRGIENEIDQFVRKHVKSQNIAFLND